jgi:hypothetical protein
MSIDMNKERLWNKMIDCGAAILIATVAYLVGYWQGEKYEAGRWDEIYKRAQAIMSPNAYVTGDAVVADTNYDVSIHVLVPGHYRWERTPIYDRIQGATVLVRDGTDRICAWDMTDSSGCAHVSLTRGRYAVMAILPTELRKERVFDVPDKLIDTILIKRKEFMADTVMIGVSMDKRKEA